MIKRLLLMLTALLVVFGGIFGWKFYQIREMGAAASQPPPPVSVAATRVQMESWRDVLHAVGDVAAVRGVQVSNEIAGQVQSILFDSGESVSEGETLLQLDATVDEAQLRGLIAERELALTRYRRAQQLLRDATVSRDEFDEAKAAWENAKAQVVSQQALIDKKLIRAPFDGVLGIRQVDIGQYLEPGTAIVSIQSLNRVYIDYSLPERRLSQINEGQTVVAQVQAFPEESFRGAIESIDSRVDEQTRNVRVRAAFDNPRQKLLPGMFARVETLMPRERKVMTLPHSAIVFNPYGDSVFVIESREQSSNAPQSAPGPGTALVARQRQVQTGEVREGRVEIVTGLSPRQQVVSAGQIKLRNGQPVSIDDSFSPGPQAPEQVSER